jgi:Protein of unknown function (DUF5674)
VTKIHVLVEKATSQQVAEMLEAFSRLRMIKIVVDVERKILAGGSGMHFDCEQLLLKDGGRQADLWGANWYPDEQDIEFEPLINTRPPINNSVILQIPEMRQMVEEVTRNLLEGVMP